MESPENHLNAQARLNEVLLRNKELTDAINKHDEQLPELLPLVREQAKLEIELELAEVLFRSARKTIEHEAEMFELTNKLRVLRGEPVLEAPPVSAPLKEEEEYNAAKMKFDSVTAQIDQL